MHCKACDAPMKYKFIEDAFTDEGDNVLEFVCDRCYLASLVNMPEDWYEGLWLDKHGHESHRVIRDPEDYLL